MSIKIQFTGGNILQPLKFVSIYPWCVILERNGYAVSCAVSAWHATNLYLTSSVSTAHHQ
jgi:hypothetical protein